jgi:glucosyl-dolichyl phosphate glucuronosyltransferase
MTANLRSEGIAARSDPAPRAEATPYREAMAPGMSCSVIICACSMDRWPDICEAVLSVQTQETPASEIVLVIDHNRELFDRCRGLGNVMVIENHEAKGVSGARNSGVAASTGDIVAFLDDDAVADPSWLKAMVPLFDDPLVRGVGAAPAPRWLSARPWWFPDEFLWVVGCAYSGLEAGSVRNGLGCGLGLRRSVFESVGGFDTRLGRNGSRLPISCEETEFSLRATRENPRAKFVYSPAAVVTHKVSTERLTFSYFLLRCFGEGVSKARVARLARAGSLATERAYVKRTLVRGVIRRFADSILKLDIRAGGRAVVMVLGLASTITGYVWEQSGLMAPG